MKKFIAVFFIILSFMLSMSVMSAQSRGDNAIGTTLGLHHAKFTIDDEKVTTDVYGSTLSYERFLIDKLALGVDVNFSMTKIKGIETTVITAMPTVSSYFQLFQNVYYAPKFGIGYAYTRMKYNSSEKFSCDGGGIVFSASILSFLFKATPTFGIKVGFLDFSSYSTTLDYEEDIYDYENFDYKNENLRIAINPNVTFQ